MSKVLTGRSQLFRWQLFAGIIIWVWTFVISWLLMRFCDMIVGVNISLRAERLGLDLIEHGEYAVGGFEVDPLVTATEHEVPNLICSMAAANQLKELKRSFKKGFDLDLAD